MTTPIRVRLVLFAMLAVVAITHAGVRYAGLGGSLVNETIRVSVDLPESGGLYAGSQVTMRGQGVGEVTDVVLSKDGVQALIEVDADRDIPKTVQATVRNRSAVGEQYLDLVPSGESTDVLKDGSTVGRAQTAVPVSEEELLDSLDDFVDDVPRQDLRTVVSELGDGYAGTGKNIQALIDGSTTLLTEARRSLPQSLRLTADSLRVLQTQADTQTEIRVSSKEFRRVFGTLAQRDPQLRRIIADAAPLSTELVRLTQSLSPVLPAFLSQMSALSGLTSLHLPAIEQALVAIPYALAGATNGVRGGRAQFVLVASPDPPVCQAGYLPPEQWRSPYDVQSLPLAFGLECAERGKVQRGARYAPR